jgi:hypothetical protein
MSSIGGIKIGKAARAERAARFAADKAGPPPPPPERRIAHPDFERSRIQRSDPEEKLVALCRRKLINGEALTPPQQAALAKLGLTPEAVLAEAELRQRSGAAVTRDVRRSRMRRPRRLPRLAPTRAMHLLCCQDCTSRLLRGWGC